MPELSKRHFGLVVAYLLPGFIVLAGLAPLSPTLAQWLHPVNAGDLGIGPPLYAVMAATAIGLVLSCFRWLLIDHFHQWTGVSAPRWDDRRLIEALDSFEYLVQAHFRYYEFTANTFIASTGVYLANRLLGTLPFLNIVTDCGMLVLAIVLFAASRDALLKYYGRTDRLIGIRTEPRVPKGVK